MMSAFWMKFSVMCHFHLSNFYVDDGNVLSFILYQTSILSGPLLAATAGSFLCLIPIHNVLEQPEYWYEEFTCRMLAGLAAGILFTINALIRTEYWSNLWEKSTDLFAIHRIDECCGCWCLHHLLLLLDQHRVIPTYAIESLKWSPYPLEDH